MNTLFQNYKCQIDPEINNYMNFIPLIKIILHKYYYSNKEYLLNMFQCIREECEVADIVYNHINRSFVMKIPRGKMTKIQKIIQKNNEKTSTGYTINDYFYGKLAVAFNIFFNTIKNDFEKKIYCIAETEEINRDDLLKSFNTLMQSPYLIVHLVQIVSIIEADNCIVLNI